MTVSLIVARNKKNTIAKDGKIPWHCSEDLKNFRELTLGGIVLMGRKTFESLNFKPLSYRLNIIITSNKEFNNEKYPNCLFFDSVGKAISILNGCSYFVIGGSSIYSYFMKNRLADKIYISQIDDDSKGDLFFDYDLAEMDYRRSSTIWKDGEPYELHIYDKIKNKPKI